MRDWKRWERGLIAAVMLAVALVGCGTTAQDAATPADGHDQMPVLTPAELGADGKLQVVATTSIVYDVVSQVGGDLIDLGLLLPLGTDPHAFEPTPQDVSAVADAHVVFSNGAGLEAFLERLLSSAGADAKAVPVSLGITLLQASGNVETAADEHDHAAGDPHTWVDPNNVMVWVGNIEAALQALDPAHSDQYAANAVAYLAELRTLDGWVREQVATIPAGNRQIVTDHQIFAYFAEEYGFVQVGAVVPSYSTMAQPTARELADLEDAIRTLHVKAIFVGNTVNPAVAETVAHDTGIQLVQLFTGSLTDAAGTAPTYLDYMRHNVRAIVDALK